MGRIYKYLTQTPDWYIAYDVSQSGPCTLSYLFSLGFRNAGSSDVTIENLTVSLSENGGQSASQTHDSVVVAAGSESDLVSLPFDVRQRDYMIRVPVRYEVGSHTESGGGITDDGFEHVGSIMAIVGTFYLECPAYVIPNPEPESYEVTFDANGGYDPPAPQIKYKGYDLTITRQEPSRVYSGGSEVGFAGWSTEPDGAVVYDRMSLYTDDAPVTLYAQWSPKPNVISVTAFRCDSDGNPNESGTYIKATAVTEYEMTEALFKWQYYDDSRPMIKASGTIDSTGRSASRVFGGSLEDRPIAISFTATNQYGESWGGTSVLSGYDHMDFSKEGGVGVGTRAREEKSLTVGVPLYANGCDLPMASYPVYHGGGTYRGVNWRARLWSNGRIEYEGAKSYSGVNVNSASGNAYFSAKQAGWTYPAPMGAGGYQSASLFNSSGNLWGNFLPGNTATSPAFYAAAAKAYTSQSFSVGIHVEGYVTDVAAAYALLKERLV